MVQPSVGCPLPSRFLTQTIGMVFGSCLCFSLAWAGPATSLKEHEREALKNALLNVVQSSALQGAGVSIQIQSLDDKSVVFAQGADDLLTPASNVKLFTAAAALVKLGPDNR